MAAGKHTLAGALACASCTASHEYVPATDREPPTVDDRPRDQELDALVQRLTWRDVSVREAEPTGLFLFVGVAPELATQWGLTSERLHRSRNPEPTWMLAFPGEETVADALQAIINRTWGMECRLDYARYKQRWSGLAEKYRPRIQVLSKAPYYEATLGLIGLHRALLADASDVYLARGRWAAQGTDLPHHPMAFQGLPFELALALAEVQERAGLEMYVVDVLKALRDPRGDAIGGSYVEIGAPNDPLHERDFYCGGAEHFGTVALPPLPIVSSIRFDGDERSRTVGWNGWSQSWSTMWTSERPRRGMERVRQARAARGLPDELSSMQFLAGKITDGWFVRLESTKATSVTRRESKLEIMFEAKGLTVKVVFDDVPSSVDVRTGDDVGVDGSIASHADTNAGRTVSMGGTHLRSVVRDGAALLELGPR